jgi:thiamine monophosphate kinase
VSLPAWTTPQHALTTSLPDVYSQSGSTPNAVQASVAWDGVTNEAVVTWNESSNPNLQHYEIRVSPGATYDSGTASVSGQVLGGIEEFRTTQELASPGDTATFKVFVVLITGNQAGSNSATITRP